MRSSEPAPLAAFADAVDPAGAVGCLRPASSASIACCCALSPLLAAAAPPPVAAPPAPAPEAAAAGAPAAEAFFPPRSKLIRSSASACAGVGSCLDCWRRASNCSKVCASPPLSPAVPPPGVALAAVGCFLPRSMAIRSSCDEATPACPPVDAPPVAAAAPVAPLFARLP